MIRPSALEFYGIAVDEYNHLYHMDDLFLNRTDNYTAQIWMSSPFRDIVGDDEGGKDRLLDAQDLTSMLERIEGEETLIIN